MENYVKDHLEPVHSPDVLQGVLKSVHSDVRQCLHLSQCFKVTNEALVSQYNIKRCQLKAQCSDNVFLLEDWGYSTVTNYGHVKRATRTGLTMAKCPIPVLGGRSCPGVLLDLDANHCLKERLCAYDSVNPSVIYLVVCKVTCRRVDKISNRLSSIEKPFSVNHDCRVLDSSCNWGFEHLDYLFCYDYTDGQTLHKRPRQVLPCYVIEFLVDWKEAAPLVATWNRQKMQFLLRQQEKLSAHAQGRDKDGEQLKRVAQSPGCTVDKTPVSSDTVSRTSPSGQPPPYHHPHNIVSNAAPCHRQQSSPATMEVQKHSSSHLNVTFTANNGLLPTNSPPTKNTNLKDLASRPCSNILMDSMLQHYSWKTEETNTFLEQSQRNAPYKISSIHPVQSPHHSPAGNNDGNNNQQPQQTNNPHDLSTTSTSNAGRVITIDSESEDDESAWQVQVPGDSGEGSPGFDSDSTLDYTFGHDELNEIIANVQAKIAARKLRKRALKSKMENPQLCDKQQNISTEAAQDEQQSMHAVEADPDGTVPVQTPVAQTIRLDASGKISLINSCGDTTPTGDDHVATVESMDVVDNSETSTTMDDILATQSSHPINHQIIDPLDIDSVMEEVFGAADDPVEGGDEVQCNLAGVPLIRQDGDTVTVDQADLRKSPVVQDDMPKSPVAQSDVPKSPVAKSVPPALHYMLTESWQENYSEYKLKDSDKNEPKKPRKPRKPRAPRGKKDKKHDILSKSSEEKAASQQVDGELPDIKPVKCWRQRTGLGMSGMTPRKMLLATQVTPQQITRGNDAVGKVAKKLFASDKNVVSGRKRSKARKDAVPEKSPRLSSDSAIRRDSGDSSSSIDVCKRSDFVTDTSEAEMESNDTQSSAAYSATQLELRCDNTNNIIGELTVLPASYQTGHAPNIQNGYSVFHPNNSEWFPPPPKLQRIPVQNSNQSPVSETTLSPPKLIPIRDLEKQYSINYNGDTCVKLSFSSVSSSLEKEKSSTFNGEDEDYTSAHERQNRTDNAEVSHMADSSNSSITEKVHSYQTSLLQNTPVMAATDSCSDNSTLPTEEVTPVTEYPCDTKHGEGNYKLPSQNYSDECENATLQTDMEVSESETGELLTSSHNEQSMLSTSSDSDIEENSQVPSLHPDGGSSVVHMRVPSPERMHANEKHTITRACNEIYIEKVIIATGQQQCGDIIENHKSDQKSVVKEQCSDQGEQLDSDAEAAGKHVQSDNDEIGIVYETAEDTIAVGQQQCGDINENHKHDQKSVVNEQSTDQGEPWTSDVEAVGKHVQNDNDEIAIVYETKEDAIAAGQQQCDDINENHKNDQKSVIKEQGTDQGERSNSDAEATAKHVESDNDEITVVYETSKDISHSTKTDDLAEQRERHTESDKNVAQSDDDDVVFLENVSKTDASLPTESTDQMENFNDDTGMNQVDCDDDDVIEEGEIVHDAEESENRNCEEKRQSNIDTVSRTHSSLSTKGIGYSEGETIKLDNKVKKTMFDTKSKGHWEDRRPSDRRREVRPLHVSHLEASERNCQRAPVPRSNDGAVKRREGRPLSPVPPPPDMPSTRFDVRQRNYPERHSLPSQRIPDSYPYADCPVPSLARTIHKNPHRPRVTLLGSGVVYRLSELVNCLDFPTTPFQTTNPIRDMPFSDVVVVLPSVDVFADPGDYCIRTIGATLQAVNDTYEGVQIILCELWHLPERPHITDEVNCKVDRVNAFMNFMGGKYGHLKVLQPDFNNGHFHTHGRHLNQYGLRRLADLIRNCLRETTSFWGQSSRNVQRFFDKYVNVR